MTLRRPRVASTRAPAACVAVFALLLVSGLPATARARAWYVSPEGRPGHAGTLRAPVDLDTANRAVSAGDVVYLRDGLYRTSIRPGVSGTAGRPIRYTRHGSEVPIITGPRPGRRFACIGLNRRHHIEVEGITCDGGAHPGARSSTVSHFVQIQGGASHDTIRDCTFMHSFEHGILINGGSQNRIVGNRLHYVGRVGLQRGEAIGLSDASHNLVEGNEVGYARHNTVELVGRSTCNVIRGNDLWNPWHRVGQAINESRRNVIEDNRIRDAATEEVVNQGVPGWKARASENVYRRNLFYGNARYGLKIVAMEDRDDAGRNRVYHNVFLANGRAGVALDDEGRRSATLGGNVFVNNVLVGNGFGAGLVQIEIDMLGGRLEGNRFIANDVLGARSGAPSIRVAGSRPESRSPADWERLRPEGFASNHELDPGFVDPGAGNVRLRAWSGLVDRGAPLTYTRTPVANKRRVRVEDATFFSDGCGVVEGDRIRIEGASLPFTVQAVDLGRGALVVDRPVSYAAGRGVSLDYTGSAPDVGVFERAGP